MPAEVQAGKPRIDLSRYELSLNGRRVKLEHQPMELLILLVQKKGQLVTREEIVRKLWVKGVFVDADQSINAAVRKIRFALKDDPTQPKYLETVVGKGYRFVGDAELIDTTDTGATAIGSGVAFSEAISGSHWRPRLLLAGVVCLVAVALLLWSWSRRSPTPKRVSAAIQSIAVLPLANLSGDPAQDYFADGMTDELITDLAQISSLRVVSRTSVMRYQHNSKSLPDIARELNVNAVVEGSIARSGDQVRITAQLVDARDDHHIWAQSYQRNFSQLLTLQNEVSRDIAEQVRVELTAAEHSRLSTPRHLSPDDYLLYLKAHYYMHPGTEASMAKAIDCFNLILSHNPSAAIAYAGLAETYGMIGTPEMIPRARDAAQKALALDANLADAHEAMASILLQYDWNLAGAGEESRRAVALNPNSASAHSGYALQLLASGDFDEALDESRKAVALDPLSVGRTTIAEMVAFFAGKHQDVTEFADRVLAVEPARQRALYWLGYSYEQQSDFAHALAEYAKADASEDGHGIILAAVGRSYALSGRLAEAQRIAKKLQQMSTHEYVWPFDAALFYTALGRKDLAFQWLEKCYQNRDGWLILLNVDPRLNGLHSDPRFEDLVRRVGLPPPRQNRTRL